MNKVCIPPPKKKLYSATQNKRARVVREKGNAVFLMLLNHAKLPWISKRSQQPGQHYSGFSLNGFNVPAFLNILDVAPAFSGTVTGVTNGCSACAGFLVPAVVAATAGVDPSDVTGWRTAFMTGNFKKYISY